MGSLIKALVLITFTLSCAIATGVIVPLYTSASDNGWGQIARIARHYPKVPIIVIINPNNGPGARRENGFAEVVHNLKLAGVKVLGYVSTVQGRRNLQKVETDIERYKLFYPQLNGLYLDEESASPAELPFYRNVVSYAKGKGFDFNVGNPSALPAAEYLKLLQGVIVHEEARLANADNASANIEEIGCFSYGITDYPVEWVKKAVKKFKYIYFTDDAGEDFNPYGRLSGHFESLVKQISDGRH